MPRPVRCRPQQNNADPWRTILNERRGGADDCDTLEDNFPTPQQRKKLRRDTLLLARTFPSSDERNQLRAIARTLAFFEAAEAEPASGSSLTRSKSAAGRPRVANPELMRRR
jgi:hypothetical protein